MDVLILYVRICHNAGGWSGQDALDDVLEYDKEKQEWNPIGSMSMKKAYHAVSVINYNSIKDYCKG